MADPLITLPDVERFFVGSFSEDQRTVVASLLAPASAIVRRDVPGIDARLLSGNVDADLVAYTVAQMIIRVVRDPNLLKSESAAPFSYERMPGAVAANLFLMPGELAQLAAASSLGAYGTVRLGVGLG